MKVHKLNLNKEVEIVCKQHGSFAQKPCDHLAGFGCPTCDSEAGKNIQGCILKTLCSDCKNNKIKKLTFDFYEKKDAFEKAHEHSLLMMALEHTGFIPKRKKHICPNTLLIGQKMKDISEQLKQLGICIY